MQIGTHLKCPSPAVHVCVHHVLFLLFSGNAHGSSSSAVRFSSSSSGPTSGWRPVMTTMSSTGEFSLEEPAVSGVTSAGH